MLPSRRAAGEKFTILITDDDDDLRETLVFDFEQNNYEVLSATNGKEAWDIIQHQEVDLVVSDIRMPVWDGVELLKHLKDVHDDDMPSLVFITAHADLPIEDAYALGAEAIFHKPFNRAELFSTVERLLEPPVQKLTRKHSRHRTNCKGAFHFAKLKRDRHGKVLNIGQGGCFISMERGLPKLEDKVSFHIEISEECFVHGTGVVRWVRQDFRGGLPPGFGIEFLEISEHSRQVFLDFLKTITTRAYIPKG